jgi:hypothetical protein
VCRQERQRLASAPSSAVPRLAQPEAACRGGPAGRLARLQQAVSECRQQAESEYPQQAAVSACRHAAGVPFRPAARLPAEWVELVESALGSAPAVAWRPRAEVAAPEMAAPSESKLAAAEWAQPVASALQALLLQAEAVAEWDAKVQPPEVESASDARVQPPEGAGAALDAAAGPQPVAAAEPDAERQPGAVEAVPDAEVALQPEEAAARGAAGLLLAAAVAVLGAGEPRPEAAEAPLGPSARLPAAERPSALPFFCRPLPWPGPRRAVRSAHGMRRSRAALPSEQLWQAARCEGLS